MSPNITSTVSSPFLPTIWAQRALDVLRANIVLAKCVAMDSDYEPGWRGKQLNIPYPGTFVAQDKVEGNIAALQAPTNQATVNVTLNKHKTVDFLVEDYANAQANSNLLDRYIQPAAIAIAEQVENDLWGVALGLQHNTGTAGTNVSAAAIVGARKALNDQKAPMTDRSLILSTKDHAAILSDSTLATYFAFSQNQALREGSTGRLYGFDMFESQFTPEVSADYTVTLGISLRRQLHALPGQSGKLRADDRLHRLRRHGGDGGRGAERAALVPGSGARHVRRHRKRRRTLRGRAGRAARRTDAAERRSDERRHGRPRGSDLLDRGDRHALDLEPGHAEGRDHHGHAPVPRSTARQRRSGGLAHR